MSCNFKLCEPCLFVKEEEAATGFCLTCAEYLCRSCTKDHRKSKLTREHSLLQDQIPENAKILRDLRDMTMCKGHDGIKVTHYCKEHDNFLCAVCYLEKHSTCEKVEKFSEDIKNDNHKTIMQCQLEEISNRTGDCLKKAEIYKTSLGHDKSFILGEKAKLMEKTISKLNELDKKCTEQLHQAFNSVLTEIDKNVCELKDIKKSCVRHQELLNTAIENVEKDAARIIACILSEKLNVLRSKVISLEHKSQPKLHFVKNPALLDLNSFGTVSVINQEIINEPVRTPTELSSDEINEQETSTYKTTGKYCATVLDKQTENFTATVPDKQTENFTATLPDKQTENLTATVPDKQTENFTATVPDKKPENFTATFDKQLKEISLNPQPSLFNISESDEVNPCDIWNILIIDQYILLLDNNNSRIKLLSLDCIILCSLRLPGRPGSCCKIDQDKFVVSFSNIKRINRYKINMDGNSLVYLGGFNTDLHNSGVSWNGENLIALMTDVAMTEENNSKSNIIELQVLNPNNGNILQTTRDFRACGTNNWLLTLNNTQGILLTDDNDLIVSEQNRILCFFLENTEYGTLAKEKRYFVGGRIIPKNDINDIAADDERLYVGTESGAVLQLSRRDYKDAKVIISGLPSIQSLQVDRQRKHLIVACEEDDYVRVYSWQ